MDCNIVTQFLRQHTNHTDLKNYDLETVECVIKFIYTGVVQIQSLSLLNKVEVAFVLLDIVSLVSKTFYPKLSF